jgi:hypothetical protein
MPHSLINLPNKEHWLAEERRGEAFSIIRNFFEWFSVGLLGLFMAVNEMVFRANLNRQNLSDLIWVVLIAFVLFVAWLLIRLTLRFKRP